MSDLISREALLKSIEKAEPRNLGWITDQITNAPAVTQQQPKPLFVGIDYSKDYVAEKVADALEEVISIIWDVLDNPELSGHGYCNDLEGRIRALIKRNAKEGE